MIIQCENIYLFETNVVDPYFFGTVDGITTTLGQSDREIDLLAINTVVFKVDVIGKGGLRYTPSYGGEDTGLFSANGKSSLAASLEFNLPVISQQIIEQMVGREFSLLAMRRDLSHFAIFARFVAEPLEIDNEVQQRITMRAQSSNAKIYEVNSFNITNIINDINTGNPSGQSAGFDYIFDFEMN